MFEERSAYPHPDEFKVMRPEYKEPGDEEYDGDDITAVIEITPFRVTGRSVSRPSARRAALYEAAKTYRNYHPGYRVASPFPDQFRDDEGTLWKRVSEFRRSTVGDYSFRLESEEEEDYANIEQMLMWDVRPVEQEEGELT